MTVAGIKQGGVQKGRPQNCIPLIRFLGRPFCTPPHQPLLSSLRTNDSRLIPNIHLNYVHDQARRVSEAIYRGIESELIGSHKTKFV
jgi:hypothetical protein